MKKYLYLFVILFSSLLFACGKKVKDGQTKTETITTEEEALNEVPPIEYSFNDTYFIGQGTEPFWSIEIAGNEVTLRTMSDSIKTLHSNPVQAMDANVKLYKLKSESSELQIQLIQTQCTNEMSGKLSPYSVKVDFKKSSEKDFTTLKGCGSYITDYRLHDIWVLESLEGEKITPSDFPKEYPMMEINSSTNTFMGFAGCNRMNGVIYFEKDLLRFMQIATTRMMCEPENKEAAFLKSLQSTNKYKIEHNRLILSNSNGDSLIFKKVD